MRDPSIQKPTDDLKAHTKILDQLKECTEIGQRLRGDPLDSYARVRDLVSLRLAQMINGRLEPSEQLLVTGITGTQTATFAATNKPGAATAGVIAWIPVVTTTGEQGYVPVFG